MAISFRHDAAAVGMEPSTAGNTNRKFGQNLVLQQQQMANQNMQRSQDRMFDLGKMHLGNQFQFVRDNRMIQADRDLLKMRNDAQEKQFMQRREFEQEDMEAAIQRDIEGQTTRQVEGRVADIRGMMSRQQYTPEGQKILGDLSGELRAIEAQRDGLRPKEYNALLNQWLDKYERAGLENYVAAPPTIDDTMSSNFKDLGNGYGVIRQPDGKLEVREIDPAKVAAGKGGGGIASMSAADYFADDSKYEAGKKRALTELENSFMAQNPDATSAPSFSADDIHAKMLKDFEEHQGFLQGLAGNQGGGQTGGQAGGQTAPPAAAPAGQAPAQSGPDLIYGIKAGDTVELEMGGTYTVEGKDGDSLILRNPRNGELVNAAPSSIKRGDRQTSPPAAPPPTAPPQNTPSQPPATQPAPATSGAGRKSYEDMTPEERAHMQHLQDMAAGRPTTAPATDFSVPNPNPGTGGLTSPYAPSGTAPPQPVGQATGQPGGASGDRLSPGGQAAVESGDDTPSIVSRIAQENLRRAKEGMYAGPRDEQGRVSGATGQDVANALGKAGADPAEMQNLMGPEAMAMMQGYGSTNPEQDLQNFWTNFLTPSMPKQKQGAKYTEIEDPVARTQAAMLPRPKSMEELHEMYKAGKIQQGGEFIAPDGTMQVYNPPQPKPKQATASDREAASRW